jgi:GntR family transcriptional regulator/MocR family aminotransferase
VTGLHLVAFFTERMRARMSDTEAAKLLLKSGIHVQPLSQNYLGEPTRRGLVFGYGRLQTEDAHRLISKMAEALSGRTS